ncbi:MAG: mechanosensitive ion channel family protein, partial [Planctomycetota bacterium]
MNDPSPAPSRLLVPGIRFARIAWRLLPAIALDLLLLTGALALGARPGVWHQVVVSAVAILVFALLRGLVFEVLAPERPELRLVRISSGRARRIEAGLRLLLALLLLTMLGEWLIRQNGGSAAVAGLLVLVRNVALVIAGSTFLYSSGFIRWLAGRHVGRFWGLLAGFTARVLVPLGVVAALFVVVARTLGYVPLADFVSKNLGLTGVRLLVAVVVFHYLRGAWHNLVHMLGSPDEDDAEASDVWDEATIAGLERIGSDVLRLVVLALAVVWILAGWELTPARLGTWLGRGIFGTGTVTWGHLLGGVGRIAVVLLAGWFLRNVLTYFIFPRARVELGARYAINAVLRYVVWALVIVFGLDALGVDTSSLGWFFGAAGVGIGLGLQDIIGNFVSGLIMLLERPIRVGDVIQVGDALGKVEAIRMRGTVLRTFDNTTILIPNRQMLSERVTNRSYGMRYARVTVDVGVGYDADPARVQEILLSVARAEDDVLDDPAPWAAFMGYGPSSLDFSLRCNTGNVNGRLGLASRLR